MPTIIIIENNNHSILAPYLTPAIITVMLISSQWTGEIGIQMKTTTPHASNWEYSVEPHRYQITYVIVHATKSIDKTVRPKSYTGGCTFVYWNSWI